METEEGESKSAEEKEPMAATSKIEEKALTKTMTEEPKTQVPLKRAEQGERHPKVTVEEVPDEKDDTSFLWSHAEPLKAKLIVLPAKLREEHLALPTKVHEALVQLENPMVNKTR
ncbi:uncharacterized protein BT62DRAFT_921687 [Guyanagaster necrorhizus]|uniref:Uncharacterized protein n=1 Tax=Guyanagaster necrorhizus TaxID=856835 RepID=A0A9P7VND2_9AGAR|nr:uncharacterized protein BT62DRAFT_921687 [Guyanagaster necrorhizus MCA 3950]KAG7443740.1 hypothetical protein BT62DRAFT_921687 [Guyanagaster necrorhizus MCA 3950]